MNETLPKLSRKAFLQMAISLAAAGVVLEACGTDTADSASAANSSAVADSTTPTNTTAVADSARATDSCKNGAKDGGINDPKHHLVVPAADIISGRAKTYSIQGTQTHDHRVKLEAADFAKVATGAQVIVTSTSKLGHTHTFFVVCA